MSDLPLSVERVGPDATRAFPGLSTTGVTSGVDALSRCAELTNGRSDRPLPRSSRRAATGMDGYLEIGAGTSHPKCEKFRIHLRSCFARAGSRIPVRRSLHPTYLTPKRSTRPDGHRRHPFP